MMALYVILAPFELHLLAPDGTVDDVLIYTPTTQTVGTVGGRRTQGCFGTQMKNSSGWTRSLRSHNRTKCNLRAICGGTSSQFSPIENADWTEYVILNWLVPGHPPEQKRGGYQDACTQWARNVLFRRKRDGTPASRKYVAVQIWFLSSQRETERKSSDIN